MLIVDAANVVGSTPDGWWRDRPGAAARLITRIGEAVAAGRLAGEAAAVTVVLEGRARSADPVVPAGVAVVRAGASGDDAIVAEVNSAVGSAPGAAVAVVTADRGLAGRVRAAGATVWPPRCLLDLL